MEPRKNPKYDINRFRSLFFNIGLVLSLLLVITAFNWKFYDQTDVMKLGSTNINFDQVLDVPITKQPPPPPPKIKNVNIVTVPNEEEIQDEISIDLDIDMTEQTAIKQTIVNAEPDEIEEEKPDEIFVIVEHQPEPVGGLTSFYNYINENISYPKTAKRLKIEGKVFVQFVVDKDGSLSNIHVIRGIGGGCDEEAVRVIKEAPNWLPGKQRGKPVRVKMVLPITFKII